MVVSGASVVANALQSTHPQGYDDIEDNRFADIDAVQPTLPLDANYFEPPPLGANYFEPTPLDANYVEPRLSPRPMDPDIVMSAAPLDGSDSLSSYSYVTNPFCSLPEGTTSLSPNAAGHALAGSANARPLGASASLETQSLDTRILNVTSSSATVEGRAKEFAMVGAKPPPLTYQFGTRHPQKAAHSHTIFLWPKVRTVLGLRSVSLLVSLAGLEFNELGWFKQLQKPNWEGSLHLFPPPGSSDGPPNFIPRYQEIFGHTLDEIHLLTNYYFDTFNILFPLLERGEFYAQNLPKALTGPESTNYHVILTLLIMALGEMSYEGVFGPPISSYEGRSSGIKGGTVDLPPGYMFFDQARQRLALAGTGNEYDVESVQTYCLTA